MAHYSYSAENENKLSYIPCDVKGRYYSDFKVKYVAYGTKGYLKTPNKEIRECKCIGTIWQHIKDYGIMRFTQWRVAGFSQPIMSKGNAPELVEEGIIYKAEHYAQVGSSTTYGHKEGHIEYNAETSVCEYLITKYDNLTYNNFHLTGTWNDLLKIKLYYVTKDHSVGSGDLWKQIEMYVDENGFNISIPNGYPYFPTESLCKAAIKPLKVFTFDDEETKPTKQNTKVKVTIEIDCDKLNDIKGIATIID